MPATGPGGAKGPSPTPPVGNSTPAQSSTSAARGTEWTTTDGTKTSSAAAAASDLGGNTSAGTDGRSGTPAGQGTPQAEAATPPVKSSEGPAASTPDASASNDSLPRTSNAAPLVPQAEPRVIPAPLAAPEPLQPVVAKTHFPYGFFFDVSPLWQRSRGFDLFSSRDISPRIGVTLEADIFDIASDIQLSLDVSAAMEQASDTILGNLETRFTSNHVLVGGRLRKSWHPLFDTHLSILGGVDRASTRIGFDDTSVDWLPMAQFGAGLSVMMPGRHRVRPGFLFEGGYVLSKKIDLPLASTQTEDSIEHSTASLGTLDRSGPYLRFSLFLRY
ncbi:MAG: hypothetical protein QM784_35120 [Polyangiaceae bacterium]